ncbi:MAG: SGNH/GDSL hydrolase family protein [Isosphaerales bacterium]
MTRRIRLAGLASLVLALLFGFGPGLRAEGPFAIKDGDRIVFYGHRITDQRLYTTFVETYIVTRYPSVSVSFVHSGWGGDRVTGGGGGPIDRRLERDVFAYKPSVVTVMLGMNDAGYQAFKPEIFDVYSRGFQHLVESIKSNLPGVRITLIQPSPYDDVTRKPGFEGGYNQVLIRYGEFLKELAGKQGAAVADLNTPVVAALKKAMEIDSTGARDLIRDRVHPGPAGQLLMAEALLKAWNAPAVVSAVELDAGSGQVVKQENAKVDALKVDGTLSWTQHDRALPMPVDLKNTVIALAMKASDVEQAINQQILKVSGLGTSRYALKIDGDDVAELSKDQLASGVNLAELDTPMFRQAKAVHELTLRHNDLHFQRWRTLQVPLERSGYPGLAKAIEALDALEADVVADQRGKAKPVPHRFELIPRK